MDLRSATALVDKIGGIILSDILHIHVCPLQIHILPLHTLTQIEQVQLLNTQGTRNYDQCGVKVLLNILQNYHIMQLSIGYRHIVNNIEQLHVYLGNLVQDHARMIHELRNICQEMDRCSGNPSMTSMTFQRQCAHCGNALGRRDSYSQILSGIV